MVIIMTSKEIYLSQAEIDYMLNCFVYLDCYTVDRDELKKKIINLPKGGKWLVSR